ncbi:T9SS type A sorting domain-containing protein [Reichenbachiella carrageenanivorans]|uniref:T9SS type A sorting domain-containing protein n=1 Tax=Reichenbachiella carrageenanivorans TaxID=2979869 RepID=A0ABY6CZQ4_9BACT|nr:T9SS type A sorting domain-containing protein [Reichenbachiella carrageenanivorans]UXX79390.1 T9SS type A sorting domain-containing protein [Reichenbachiella carrageenanivorans]
MKKLIQLTMIIILLSTGFQSWSQVIYEEDLESRTGDDTGEMKGNGYTALLVTTSGEGAGGSNNFVSTAPRNTNTQLNTTVVYPNEGMFLASKTYVWKVTLKQVDASASPGLINFRIYDASSQPIRLFESPSKFTGVINTWTEVEMEFTPDQDMTGIQFRLLKTPTDDAASVLYVDDFEISEVVAPSSDATLATLKVGDETVDISGGSPFTYDAPYSSSGLPPVVATTTDDGATIGSQTVTDNWPAASTVAFTVTAEDGTTTADYSITINRAAPATDATLATLTIGGEAIDMAGGSPFTYDAPFSSSGLPTVVATATDANAMVGSQTITDNWPAASTVAFTVTAEDGTTTADYSITINRAAVSTDATLSDLQVDGVTVSGFDAGTLSYDVQLPTGTTAISVVSATANYAGAQPLVITQATAVTGTATVEVTAEDGTTSQSYMVNFSVKAATDATLSSLKIDGTSIAGFTSGTMDYDYEVPVETTGIPQVTATTTDANANMVITQATATDGEATVVVTAEDGTTTKTYTVDFYLETIVTQVSDNQLKNSFNIYPNPAGNTIVIDDSFSKLDQVTIIDMQGHLSVRRVTNDRIDIADLNPGVYILKVSQQQSIRFIKK